MPVTGMLLVDTVTDAVVDTFEPSVLVTVMVAEPFAIALTSPFVTVATPELLDNHDTVLLAAFDGATVTDNCDVCVGDKNNAVEVSVNPVTRITDVVTVTDVVAVTFEPSVLAAVMVAEPAATAVMSPVFDTVATPELLVDHVSALFVALDGATVAVSCDVCDGVRDTLDEFKVIPVTDTVFSR